MVNIFIDTQVFVQKNFNFKNNLFENLIYHSQNGIVSIYLTDISKKEIESKIKEQVYEKLVASNSKFIKEARILKNLSTYNNVFKISERIDDIFKDLLKQFNEFLDKGKVKMISVDNVAPTTIFEMYFQGIPPFSGKKKHEFPDAFTLVSLENWFKSSNQELTIISNDSDLSHYCEKSDILKYEKSLESFFDSLIKSSNYKYQYIVAICETNSLEIESHVIDELDYDVFTLVGEEGEVDSVTIESIELEDEPLIIDVGDEDEGIATVAMDFHVYLSAQISFFDQDTAVYDKEDGRLIYIETVEKEVEYDTPFTVVMKVQYNINDKEDFKIISMVINDGDFIEINTTFTY